MAGSNIFVIYADTSGTNVTLSPRLGTGEVMPMMDKTANVSLLGGSGIARGMMTANIMCMFFFTHPVETRFSCYLSTSSSRSC